MTNVRNFRAEALENGDSLPVSRQRQTDGLFAFGESASEVAACGSLSAAGALPAMRATARSPWPEGRSARRGNGLRNYECFPFSQIIHFRKVKIIIQKRKTHTSKIYFIK